MAQLRAPLLCAALALSFAAAAMAQGSTAGSTTTPVAASEVTPGDADPTAGLGTPEAPCVEGDNCVKGPCHFHAACQSDQCIYINSDDGSFCEDQDGFGGTCLAGECQVQRQAAIKSNGDDLVFHTPTGGDFLFSSSDLDKDLSARGMAMDLEEAVEAVASLNTRASMIEATAEDADADVAGLNARITAINDDVTAQIVDVNAYVGQVEAKADTNADDIVETGDKVAANNDAIAALQNKDSVFDGQLASLESAKATRDELNTAVSDLEDQLQEEASDIRVLQDEMATKVIQLTDDTTAHNSFIQDMQANIASLGGRVDSNDNDITDLRNTRLTQEQVEGVVGNALTPVKDELKGDISQLRAELDAIDLEPLEKKIELNTIVARSAAGIGLGKTLTDTEARKAAAKSCAAESKGFDYKNFKCVECASGMVDEDTGYCQDHNMRTGRLGETISVSMCSGQWHYDMLGETNNQVVYKLKEAALVEITVTMDVTLDVDSGCGYNYAYARLYPRIDGQQQSYCSYPYIYQYKSSNRGDTTVRRPMICTKTYNLGAGEHVIDLDMYMQGHDYKIHHDTSLITVRALSKPATTAATEPSKCAGKTAQTLLDTYQQSSYGTGCTSRTIDMNSYFNTRGPWTLSSRTGRVRITYRTRVRIRSDSCYIANRYAYFQVRPRIDNTYLSYSATLRNKAQYRYEYEYMPVFVDFFYDVGVGSFRLELDAYMRGDYTYIYGSSGFSTLRVEDIPKEDRDPKDVQLPTGCKGVPRRYLVQSYVTTQSSISNTNGATRWLTLRDGSSNRNSLTFNVPQDETKLHLYVKVQAYLSTSSSYGGASAMARLIPYVDGKSQGTCMERYSDIYNSYSDDDEGAQVCSVILTLDKGEHTLQLQHYGRGYRSYIRGSTTARDSMILLEELVHNAF